MDSAASARWVLRLCVMRLGWDVCVKLAGGAVIGSDG